MTGATGAISSSIDVRYVGQSHEITIPYSPGDDPAVLRRRFEQAHSARNGFDRPGDRYEVVTVRAAATGSPALEWSRLPPPQPRGESRRPDRTVNVAGEPTPVAVWWRPALATGSRVVGPAVIEESEATTYLGPGERATVHGSGALEVEW
jgi:N-methylhydantoinase A/oxoprolinase/acetone carboxylase beta subunit